MFTPVLFSALLAAQPLDSGHTVYDITITDRGPDPARVEVTLQFRGEEDGTTLIHLPNEWGGEAELWNNIGHLEISGDEARLEDGDTPYQRVAHHAPGGDVTLRYTLSPDRPGEPEAARGDYYRPVILPTAVHLIGTTWIAIPDTITEAITVDLNAPANWTLASDLEHGDLTAQSLAESILVAGDFRIETRTINGAELRVAIRGEHVASDVEFADMAEAVLRANQAYWQSPGDDFLISVLPLVTEPGASSIGGTNLFDSFAFFATDNAEIDILKRILMHEHVHTWNPGRLGGLTDGPTQPGEYWFSEGFTDFLTQRAGVQGGVWDAETAVRNWNESLVENASSPVRDAPNSAIETGFWTDGDFQRLPYHRGMIFAALLDHRIREHTAGTQDLDDILFALRETADAGTAPSRLAAVIEAETGLAVADLVQRHMIDGVPVDLPRETFAACGPLETFEQPVFDYGMTGYRDEEGRFIIDSVDPNGPAAPAGFEPGMRIVERVEGAVGDASIDSVLRVELNNEIQDLRYRPTNGEILRFQQIMLPETDLPDACTALLAGE